MKFMHNGGEDMEKYIIHGGNKLFGEVEIKGAKNSVLPILAATVISGKVSTIGNIPNLKDVEIMEKLLSSLGAKLEYKDNHLCIDSSTIDNVILPEELVREMRSSIILMGALLARFKEVKISYPGGCDTLLVQMDYLI